MQMIIAPTLLTATTSSDGLELRPGGSWTAANVVALESLSAAVVPQLERSKSVTVDLAEVRELDTLGAWLIEKMSRRVASAGRRTKIIGVRENYAGLIEEVSQVNRRSLEGARAKPCPVKVG
jgi:phospholipid/cholesterol/gamma-HCH transport system permease protein